MQGESNGTGPGSADRRPNLFLLGAMKSATGTLHRHLKQHPDVFMCEPKEPCYFVERSQLNWPFIEALGLWRGEEYYLQLFEGAGDATVIGESSTMYTKLPQITGVPERIAAFNPDARFIYIMRDPIERAVSHYWHTVRWDDERRTPEEALLGDPMYVDVSDYAMQLQPYLDLFDREQILVLTTEEFSRDTVPSVRRLYEWLGVDPEAAVDADGVRANKTPEESIVRRKSWMVPIERLRWSKAYRVVRPLVPQSLRTSARGVGQESVEKVEIGEDVYAELRRRLEPRVARLEELLDRSFRDEWRTLYTPTP
jgi:Sulfotransferase family